MGKLGRLGLEPAQRYERVRPGELIHIDVEELGRIHRSAGHRVTGKRGRLGQARRVVDRDMHELPADGRADPALGVGALPVAGESGPLERRGETTDCGSRTDTP
jgi:hypothetical protein